MKKKKKLKAHVREDEPKLADDGSWLHAITRFWVTLFIIAAILYGTFLMVGRTDGFKGLIRQRLENITGGPLTIERVNVSPRLEMVLEGIREGGSFTNRGPGLVIEKARLRFRIMPLLRGDSWPFSLLSIQGGALIFRQQKDGVWTPLPKIHEGLAPRLGIATESALPQQDEAPMEFLRRVRATLDIDRFNLAWMGATPEETPLAVFEGIHVNVRPVQPYDTPVLWCKLRVQHGNNAGREWLRDLQMEWIHLQDQDVVIRLAGVIDGKATGP